MAGSNGSDGTGQVTAPLPVIGPGDDPLVVLDDDDLVFLGDPTEPTDTAEADAAEADRAAADGAEAPRAPEAPVPAPPAPKVIRIGFDDDVPPEDPVALGSTARVAPVSVPNERPPVAHGGSEAARPTITITDESLAPLQDATAPAEIDPRLRARRIGVLRGVGLRRLRVALGVAAVLLLVVGGLVLSKSPLMSVDHVELDGAAYVNRERLAQVVGDVHGTPLLEVDTGDVEDALAADPWVKRVRVERDWFTGLRIELAERVPVAAYMGEDQGWRIVDADGSVIASLEPGHKPVDFVTIQSTAPGPDLAPGGVAAGPLAVGAAVAPRLPDTLRAALDHLAVGEDGELELVLTSGGRIVIGRPDRLRDKLISTMVALDQVELDDVEVLDVSTPEQPALRLRSS
jgi:cell division protein FtsQ